MTTSLSVIRCLSALRPQSGSRIGLLGGSFNPAHAGHLHISRMALCHLGLDEVWWLVSPQNPLKPAEGMGTLEGRLARARAVAARARGRIRVSPIETAFGTQHTVDTIRALKPRFPGRKFVWLMGADNLIQLPKWKGWQALFGLVPIAVFPRPSYSLRALDSRAAAMFAPHRKKGKGAAGSLADKKPPAWVFLDIRNHSASATRIRENEKSVV